MFSKETQKARLEARIALLTARDPMANQYLINKIKRRLRLLGENV